MHFRDHSGLTWHHVKAECEEHGWEYYDWYIDDNSYATKSADVLRGVRNYLRQRDIDLLVVHGDRAEALGAAMIALDGYRVAHVEGGEITSTADEITRHAITKLAHMHLVSSKIAARRVMQMGESAESVEVIGSPDIDILLDQDVRPNITQVWNRYPDLKGIDPKMGYGVVLYHPVSFLTNAKQGKDAKAVGDALLPPKQWVVIGTNDDPGWEAVNAQLCNRVSRKKGCCYLPSMRFEYFVSLLEAASVLVGNSSCGIMEAPVLGVPTINVGPRQDGRAADFNIKSVKDVDADSSEIVHAIDTYWGRRYERDTSFGDGDSAYRFAQVLVDDKTWSLPLQKQFEPRSWKPAAKYSKRRYI